MVSLRPDHPYPLVARPRSAERDASRLRRLVRLTRSRGKHRTPRVWRLYRSIHADPERSGIARLLPSWHHYRIRPATAEPAAHRPGPARALTLTPPPAPTPAPQPTVQVRVRPRITELARSQLLPPAGSTKDSPLAALLGFGETEATFNGDWSDGIGPPAETDDYWSRLRTLSRNQDRPDNMGDTVKMLWDATADWDIDSKLLSTEVTHEPYKQSRRMTWLAIAMLVLLAGLIGISVKLMNDLPERAIEVREAQYAEAARQMSEALAPIGHSLVGGGLLDDSGLSTLTGQLMSLDSAARFSATVAAEQLPRRPILGSSLPVDALNVPKELLESASTQALAVGRRVGDAAAYSLTLSEVFVLPPLPAKAPLAEVDAIAVQLSTSIAETELALSSLPDDSFFALFRQQASETLTSLEQAQADYITALRTLDPIGAAEVSTQMNASVERVQEELQIPLGEVQTWAQGQITQLQTVTDEIESGL